MRPGILVFLTLFLIPYLLPICVVAGSSDAPMYPVSEEDKGNDKYPFPSIMREDDWVPAYVDGKARRGLRIVLLASGWRAVSDRYRRQYRFDSPEMTYDELQNLLHFQDGDVRPIHESGPSGPHASIVTNSLSCMISYSGMPYDGRDKAVRLKATIVDIAAEERSRKHLEYDTNRSVFEKILDFLGDW